MQRLFLPVAAVALLLPGALAEPAPAQLAPLIGG